jgi:hypothetical protein
MYTLENMTMKWFSNKDTLYKITKNIPSAVYCFAMAETMPSDTILPFMMRELVYVGMSGGLKNDYTGDKKNKNSNKVTLTTAVHQRLKTHIRLLENRNNILGHAEETKYALFHDSYPILTRQDKKLYIGLLVPQSHIPKDNMRNILSLVESEQIYLHSKLYKKLPLMNLSESNNYGDNRKKVDSYSQQEIQRISSQNLYSLSEC